MQDADQWVTVATGLNEARANELALVLIARGLSFERQRGVSGWEIWVPMVSAAAAASELTQYRRENSRAIGPRELVQVPGAWWGVGVYAFVLGTVFLALHGWWFAVDWLYLGRLQSRAVLNGEWWRVVTALTLHIDLDHLGGNLVFGAFFGYFLGRYLGGVGWLVVLVCAALGNATNAVLQPVTHTSIGASTAVFAALGLLAAYTWRRGYLRDTPWRARIAPVIAALGLLAFTGTGGENTDLGAHLFGFAAGFVGGLGLAAGFSPTWLLRPRVHHVCGFAAVGLVMVAWLWAFAQS